VECSFPHLSHFHPRMGEYILNEDLTDNTKKLKEVTQEKYKEKGKQINIE